MTSTPHNSPGDRDGVRIFAKSTPRRRRRIALVAGATAAVALLALGILLADRESTDPHFSPALTTPEGTKKTSSWAAPATVRERDGARRPPGARQDKPPEVVVREAIEALRAAGKTEGIAAFNPPGTDPIKLGLVVPDDFELPEGYVRHYQLTDSGERLEPILMFSPDYEFLDAAGNPLPLPENGIVPPDMAPPGLPIRLLEMPKNPYGSGTR